MGGCAVSGSLGCARSISSKVLLGVVLWVGFWVFYCGFDSPWVWCNRSPCGLWGVCVVSLIVVTSVMFCGWLRCFCAADLVVWFASGRLLVFGFVVTV